mgnify:CR=1 FL=1
MAIIETRQKKHGIQSINLIDYFPNFIDDCKKERVSWQKANEDISSRIQTFLILIAKLNHHRLEAGGFGLAAESSLKLTNLEVIALLSFF